MGPMMRLRMAWLIERRTIRELMQRLTCCSSFPSLVAARLGPDSTVLGWSTNRTGPDLVPRLSLGVLESTSMWIAGGREALIPAACRSVVSRQPPDRVLAALLPSWPA